MKSVANVVNVAYVALGANLDDPAGQLERAIDALGQLSGCALTARSSLYATEPIGLENQPDFVNAVVALETGLSAPQLLDALLELEIRLGRVRGEEQNGPRHIDLDLLLFGDAVIDSPRLQLPHPRMHLRAFVLAPLDEIAPDCPIPGRGCVKAWLPAVAGQRIDKL